MYVKVVTSHTESAPVPTMRTKWAEETHDRPGKTTPHAVSERQPSPWVRYPQSKTETYTGEWADGRTRFPVGCLAVRDARPKGEHDRLGLAVTLANDRMFLRFGQFIDHIYLLACLEFAGIQATNTVTP